MNLIARLPMRRQLELFVDPSPALRLLFDDHSPPNTVAQFAPVSASRTDVFRSFQFGRTSAPTMPHLVLKTIRGPNSRTRRSPGY
jgi:hypothetical protein